MQTTTTSEPHVFAEPTEPVSWRYTVTMVLAQFVFFVALLGPAVVGIGVKVLTIVPDEEKTSAIATIAGWGALAALVANVVFGRLSDRTTSRWGRRRPWIVSGTIVMTSAFVVMATGRSVLVVTIGWFIAQLGANAAFSPFVATIADQVPQFQRAKLSALMGIAQNVGILGGVYIAEVFVDRLLIMFVGPAILAILAMLLFAVVLPDQHLPVKPPAMTVKDWVRTFWVSPREHPDFGLAWLSRFLLVLATFMFTTYRLFFLKDRIHLPTEKAVSAVTIGVLIYTIALVASGYVAGLISDRTGRRKALVATSAVVFGIGTAVLAHISTLSGFYAAEAIMGLAYGIYMGVDLALVVDVLPNPDESAKDLGVFNIANALPQTLAPIVGAFFLAINSVPKQNYTMLLWAAGVAAILGGLVVLPIKKVK